MSGDDATADVLAVVAHTLLGSVASIRGAASLLARPGLSPEQHAELAALLGAATDHLDGLLRGLLRGEPLDCAAGGVPSAVS